MTTSILTRYLDPHVLSRLAGRTVEPRGLVMGNLAGAHKSPMSGFAVEFSGHREYVIGDDPKHIDWRMFYTRDKYFIKQYEMETNFVCHLILDVSASMRYGDGAEQKLRYAAEMASTLGFGIIRQNDKVSLATIDDRVRGFLRPSNSMAQVLRMTEHLDRSKSVEKTQLGETLAELTGRMQRREIVMIFSDFLTDLSGLESALQQMRYQQHEIVLFHVLHHDEQEFEFDGMVKFHGLEGGDDLLTQTEDIREGYLQALREYKHQFTQLCQRNLIERVDVDTRRPLAEVLIDYLNHRSRMNRGR